MSLVFAAITPHPPLLIPTIGKQHLKKIAQTEKAMRRLEEELYLAKPDVLVVISPHGHLFSDSFSVNLCQAFETDLKQFGDLATRLTFRGDTTLPARLRAKASQEGLPTKIISEPRLDHGAAVPLYYLTQHLPKASIVPVGFCDLDLKAHLDFGYALKEVIMKSNRRIAVIASGDLSHALTTDAPAGFHPAGAEFDQKIQDLLAARNTAGIVTLPNELLAQAAECGLRSILILMGVLRNLQTTFQSYSYECPFGVGYLTANFVI